MLFLAGCACPGRADDTTRRVQEELRKRNLYFGAVDGRMNQGVVGALKRYQETKGFTVTGDEDEMTLRSLSIPPAERGRAEPWPDIPILRSDTARQSPPEAAQSASPGTTASGAAVPIPTPSITPRPPAASEVTLPITGEKAGEFIAAYLRADETNVPADEMAFYGDRVDYFDYGIVDQAFILRDIQYYYRRWPERTFEVVSPVSVSPEAGTGNAIARFRLRYSYKGVHEGRQISVTGLTDNAFAIHVDASGERRIVGMKEQRVRSP